MTRWMKAFAALTASALLAACGGGGGDNTAAPADPAQRDLAQAAKAEGNLERLVAAAEAAGLMGTMRGSEPMTLLAPTDAAMTEIDAEMADLMKPEAKAELVEFVKAHLVPSKMLAEQMMTAAGGQKASVNNLLGDSIDLEVQDGKLMVNGVAAQKTNVAAKNGVIHVFFAPIWRPSVFGIVRTLPNTSILEQAIRNAGLRDALRGDGPFTLFAPTNAAFEKLLTELNITAEALLADKALLTKVLTYHVLPARVLARDVQDDATAATLQGESLRFDVTTEGKRRQITLTDANGRTSKVVFANLHARNGVVHLIDRVVLPKVDAPPPPPPPTQNIVEIAQGNPDFSILVEAVVAAELAGTLSGAGPFTVFAPTNAAFAKLLEELKVTKEALLADKALLTQVLTYHVLAGQVLAADIKDNATPSTVQGQPIRLDTDGGKVVITDARGRTSNVTATDIKATNGVIHVIDTVILPTTQNIVQIAQSLPQFSILVEAVVAAGLADAVSGGTLTVFAPTNDAFAALLAELKVTKEALLADKALLTKVLTYHVLPARVLKADVPVGKPITTLQGGTFTIDKNFVITDASHRTAKIVATDVIATNGVIHVIDKVILPGS
jgi:transforming growth factor-beta-induced protein